MFLNTNIYGMIYNNSNGLEVLNCAVQMHSTSKSSMCDWVSRWMNEELLPVLDISHKIM